MGQGVFCSSCGTRIPDPLRRDPCPKCGSLDRTVLAQPVEILSFVDSITPTTRKAFLNKYPVIKLANWAISVGIVIVLAFLSPPLAIPLGLVALALGPTPLSWLLSRLRTVTK